MTSNETLLPVALRAYAVATKQKDKRKWQPPERLDEPSEWVVTFDTETTIDETQSLRIGSYLIYQGAEQKDAGLFYEPDVISAGNLSTIRKYAAAHKLTVLTRAEFVEQVIYGIGYDLGATIVGLNLPFDLSRLAVEWGKARRRMYGGFSFRLSENPWRPWLRIKHLSSRQSLISFARPRPNVARGERKRQLMTPDRPGFFVDIRTLAAALTSESHSLASLSQHLFGEVLKGQTEEHGGPITATYLKYAMNDAEVTYKCYLALLAKYKSYDLTKTPVHRILSEASLGKAHLREMGVRSHRECQPDFPAYLSGIILSTYYGGRAEIRIRREIKRVLYCDFLSMYPTVCTLMGLWPFVIAEGVEWEDATAEIREMLARTTIADIQNPEFWKSLPVVVQILPARDILPVRARYDGAAWTIGNNFFSHEDPLWYTLADFLASKILCGKPPQVLKAWRFKPKAAQSGLKPIHINGVAEFEIQPTRDDLYKRLIDLRSRAKQARDAARRVGDKREVNEQDILQNALKTCANATSYGIFVELNVIRHANSKKVECFGIEDKSHFPKIRNIEEPGLYFHPLLATLITGAARLMLASAEKLAEMEGLSWAFCDTDSMALARPDNMADAEFIERAKRIAQWFTGLNPYEKKEPLFKIEDANYRLNAFPRKFEPLYCLCISAKRYVLFNIDAEGRPIIRKASAHGLGHLLAPYGDDNTPACIPTPADALKNIGVERWQYDLWYKIIEACQKGTPNQIDLSYHPALEQPAVSKYGATTPVLLSWFDRLNKGKSYIKSVKPFNFMLMFQTSRVAWLDEQHDDSNDEDLSTLPAVSAPYNKDPRKAIPKAFDRRTGRPVKANLLISYRELLMQYHLQPESKFENGDFTDRGITRRRYIRPFLVRYIGKEANRWEEQFFTGMSIDAQIDYDISPKNLRMAAKNLRKALGKFRQRDVAREASVSLRDVSAFMSGKGLITSKLLMRLYRLLKPD